MFFLVLIAAAALFAGSIGLGLIFQKRPLKPDDHLYSQSVLEAAEASSKKLGKIVVAASLISLVGCAAWYFGVYKNEHNSRIRKMDELMQNEELQEISRQRLAREFVSKHLKDPESAKFSDQQGYCGVVNAKNSFGAYGGGKRFIAPRRELVFLEEAISAADFNKAWQTMCD